MNIIERLRSGEDSLEYCAADEIERLLTILKPFAQALKDNWSYQDDSMEILAGPKHDLRLVLTLGDFRNAKCILDEYL
jgi:hypothetical protein